MECDSHLIGLSVVASGKLLTPVCLYHQAVYFGTDQGGDLFDWESNCGPGGK